MLNVLALLISKATRSTPRPPSYLVTIESPREAPRKAAVLSFRLVPKGGRLVPVPLGRQPYPVRRGVAFTTPLLGLGGRLALVQRSDSAGPDYVSVWSASPLRRLSAIQCAFNSYVAWLPGLDALSIVEHNSVSCATRIVRADGTPLASLGGTLAAFADPKAHAIWLVSSSLPASDVEGFFVAGDLGASFVQAVKRGSVWIERLDAPFRRKPVRTSLRTALDQLLGRSATAWDLAFLVQPVRRARGFAQHWAYSEGPKQVAWTKDGLGLYGSVLGYPRVAARLTTLESGGDAAFSTTLDGALVYSGHVGALPGQPDSIEGFTGVWLDRRHRKTWIVPYRPAFGVLLWK